MENRKDVAEHGASYGEDEIICPYCGNVHEDNGEIDDGDFECEECEKTFAVEKDYHVSFSTERKKEKQPSTEQKPEQKP